MREGESNSPISPDKMSDKQIVDSIFAQVKPDMLARDRLFERYGRLYAENHRLNYAGKLLNLHIDYEEGKIWTSIRNISDKKELHTTTYLYTAAKEVMQEAVNKLGKEMNYTLQTDNEKMKIWAETKGNEIFTWDTTQNHPEKQFPYEFTKKIVPEEKYE